MRFRSTSVLIAAASVVAATAGLAHIRLHTGNPAQPLFWSSSSNVGLVINSTGSDNLPDGSHFTAIRNAYESWNGVGGTGAMIVEDTSPSQQARTDWQASNIHLVWFDETDASGYFPGASGTVAITPLLFSVPSGSIIDADVLFNGNDHQFTTSGVVGRFDVQSVAAHELGHLLGFDHSALGGATMFPYVSTTVIAQRSLSLDDQNAMRNAYPNTTHATVSGTIQRQSDSSAVAGAHVVARDATTGRTAGAALCNSSGAFSISGLAAGTYELYAHPLIGAVTSANLQAGHTIATDFNPTVLGSFAVVAGSNAVGTHQVIDPGSGFSLGASGSPLPLRGIAGQNNTGFVLGGSGLSAGSSLIASDPDVVIGNVVWGTTFVSFEVNVPGGEAPGHFDLQVENPPGTIRSILPAAVEVSPPDPTVTNVTPSSGTISGGTALTITGTGFRAGARVVVGGEIYRDGDPGVTVVDSTTITLTTGATSAGTYDVVVIDESGFEGRMTNAYQFRPVPVVASLFPTAGDASGGTQLVITGQDFVSGLSVTIDGVNQPNVTVDSATRLRVTTEPGTAGGPYVLRVADMGGAFADTAYSYVGQADPQIASVLPASGSPAGGDTITVTGTGFTANSQVSFGADPDTGAGGMAATMTTFVDASTLEVVTPAFGVGTTSVAVVDGSTAQGTVNASAFQFGSSGGGGGGCYTEIVADRQGPGAALQSAAWAIALALCALYHWRRAVRRKVALG